MSLELVFWVVDNASFSTAFRISVNDIALLSFGVVVEVDNETFSTAFRIPVTATVLVSFDVVLYLVSSPEMKDTREINSHALIDTHSNKERIVQLENARTFYYMSLGRRPDTQGQSNPVFPNLALFTAHYLM